MKISWKRLSSTKIFIPTSFLKKKYLCKQKIISSHCNTTKVYYYFLLNAIPLSESQLFKPPPSRSSLWVYGGFQQRCPWNIERSWFRMHRTSFALVHLNLFIEKSCFFSLFVCVVVKCVFVRVFLITISLQCSWLWRECTKRLNASPRGHVRRWYCALICKGKCIRSRLTTLVE